MSLKLCLTISILSLLSLTVNAQVQQAAFQSEGVELPAFLHQAHGDGYHPTVIYLHGNPGSKLDASSALADKLNAEGINVLRFNYRGLWGNGGEFTLSNAVGDVSSALDFLTMPGNIDRFRIDTTRTVVAGYSFGSTTALVASFTDPRIREIIGLGLCDHSHFGKEFLNPQSKIRQFLEVTVEALFGENGIIDQEPAIFVDDLVENIYRFGLVEHAGDLAEKRLLFVVGVNDLVCPIEDHVLPLYRALRRANHSGLELKIFHTGHDFSDIPQDTIYEVFGEWIHARD